MELLDLLLEHLYKPLYMLAVLVSLIKYPKYYNTPLNLFPVLLMYTLITELLGYLTKNYEIYNISIFLAFEEHNVIIYNIYNIIFFIFFFYVYWSYIDNQKYKDHIRYGSILFLVISVVNLLFQSFKMESQTYSYLAGGLLTIYFTILFFLDQKKIKKPQDYRLTSLKWFSIGLFIYYVGYLPIKASRYYNYLYNINEYMHLRRIHLLLVCILYSCFIIGLMKMRRKFWI